MKNISINEEQKLYVIPSGDGYSCLGFDVAFHRAKSMADELGDSSVQPDPANKGTPAGYADYIRAIDAVRASGRKLGLQFDEGTPESVKAIIRAEIGTGRALRFHIGNRETGEVWLEEFDVMGILGRTTGILPAPIILKNSASSGGPILLTGCILRIQDVKTKRDLYRAENYKLPALDIVPAPYPDKPEYTHAVYRNGENQAAFKSLKGAQNYIAFMRGERMRVG